MHGKFYQQALTLFIDKSHLPHPDALNPAQGTWRKQYRLSVRIVYHRVMLNNRHNNEIQYLLALAPYIYLIFLVQPLCTVKYITYLGICPIYCPIALNIASIPTHPMD
jgi:hypothetical protein